MAGKKTKKKQGITSKNSVSIVRIILACFALITIIAAFKINENNNRKFVCANSISCIKNLSVDIENNAVGVFAGQQVIPPKIYLNNNNANKTVLGASTKQDQKHIYVNLSTQTLYAYQGKSLILKTLISSGKWYPTPDGNFTVWIRLLSTRMTGGSGEDYYNLPNVPYVMYFYNQDVPQADGFSLHGAYWHDNFGHPMSHGCINMRIVDAKTLYNWVAPYGNSGTTLASADNPGTPVTIFGKAPN